MKEIFTFIAILNCDLLRVTELLNLQPSTVAPEWVPT